MTVLSGRKHSLSEHSQAGPGMEKPRQLGWFCRHVHVLTPASKLGPSFSVLTKRLPLADFRFVYL